MDRTPRHLHRRLALAAGLMLASTGLVAEAAAPRGNHGIDGWRMEWELAPVSDSREAPAARNPWSKLRNLDQGGFSWDFNAPSSRRPLPELRWGPRNAAGPSARLRYSRWSGAQAGAPNPSGRVPQIVMMWRY